MHTWLLFNAGAACEALCAALAEGGARAGAAERVLGGTLEVLLRAHAASGRPDVRTGYGVPCTLQTGAGRPVWLLQTRRSVATLFTLNMCACMHHRGEFLPGTSGLVRAVSMTAGRDFDFRPPVYSALPGPVGGSSPLLLRRPQAQRR